MRFTFTLGETLAPVEVFVIPPPDTDKLLLDRICAILHSQTETMFFRDNKTTTKVSRRVSSSSDTHDAAKSFLQRSVLVAQPGTVAVPVKLAANFSILPRHETSVTGFSVTAPAPNAEAIIEARVVNWDELATLHGDGIDNVWDALVIARSIGNWSQSDKSSKV